MLVLGILAAGGVYTGTNPAYTARELAHHVSVTKAKLFIVEPELLKPMQAALKPINNHNPSVFLFNHDDKKHDLLSWTTLLDHGEVDWYRFDDEQTSRNTTAMLLTTSGTTGLPKAAMISHYNLIAEHTLVWNRTAQKQPWQTSSLIALPMFHAATAPFVHTSVLRAGWPAYIMRKFDVDAYMAAVDKYKITEVIMVPPVVLRIVMSPHVREYDLTSIKRAYVGAAPCDSELQVRFEKLIGGPLLQVWGMTESCCIIS